MSMSDDPAGFRRGQPTERRPLRDTPYADDRRPGAGSEAQTTRGRPQYHESGDGDGEPSGRPAPTVVRTTSGRPSTPQPASPYGGYTARSDARVEPRLDPRRDSYTPPYGVETRRPETVRPGWDQPRREPAPGAYPPYPAPAASETRRHSGQTPYYSQEAQAYAEEPTAYPQAPQAYPQAPQAYSQPTKPYPQPAQPYTEESPAYPPVTQAYPPETHDYEPEPQPYTPAPGATALRRPGVPRDPKPEAGAPQSAAEQPYAPAGADYEEKPRYEPSYATTEYYRHSGSDYQTPSYRPATPAYERGPATEHYAPSQTARPTDGARSFESEVRTRRESFYAPDAEEADQHGLMGGRAEPTTQRYPAQPYGDHPDPVDGEAQPHLEADPRARAYPVARTTADDEMDADFFADDEDFDTEEEVEEEERRGGRKLMAAAIAGAILVAGGATYYFKVHRAGEAGGSEPPTFAADGKPFKDAPLNPGGKTHANGSKAIYDRLGGDGSGAGVSEEGGAQNASATGGGRAPGTIDERIERALQDAKSQSDGGGRGAQQGDAPRTVRTFRVDPSGATDQGQSRSGGIETASASPDSGAADGQAAMAARGLPEPSPASPESDGARHRGIKVIAEAPAQPAAADSTAASSGYFAQLGARNDEKQALAALTEVQNKYGSVLGGYTPEIHRADLGSKGVWYRLWVGPIEDKTAANGLCDKLKGAGLKACMVVKKQ